MDHTVKSGGQDGSEVLWEKQDRTTLQPVGQLNTKDGPISSATQTCATSVPFRQMKKKAPSPRIVLTWLLGAEQPGGIRVPLRATLSVFTGEPLTLSSCLQMRKHLKSKVGSGSD